MNSPLNIEPIFVSVPGIFTASACELWFGEQLCKSWRPAQPSTSCPHCKVALELLVLRAADHVQALEDRRKEQREP